jgi:FkbM family methyltransferase
MPAPASGPANARSWTDTIARGGQQARLVNLGIFKNDILRYDCLPLAVDVGAADFNAQIGYEQLVMAGLAKVLGFEPDPESFAKLKQSENSKHLKLALGDGQDHKLSICNAPGMNSILSPRQEWLSLFPMFSNWGTVNSQIPVATSRLDDVKEAQNARFLKIDVQGAEMMILEHGQQVLNGLALLQIEASPSPLYDGEASLWKIGEWLSERGFVLHCFSDLNKRRLKPFGKDEAPFAPSNQLFQVDAVFMPDPLKWTELDDDRLLSLAFFAHAVYRSYDVAMLAMRKLDERDDNGRVGRYSQYLEAAGLDA